MGPIGVSEMREVGPYVEENFIVTNWGFLKQQTKLHPLMPAGGLERLIV